MDDSCDLTTVVTGPLDERRYKDRRRIPFPTHIYSLTQQTLRFSWRLLVAADCTCEYSKWQWQGLKIASHASLPLILRAMGTITHAAEAPSATEDETDTSSGQRGSEQSDQGLEEGFGRDEELEVPEYERLRQLNLVKNSLKL
jgi:hypothetical protein